MWGAATMLLERHGADAPRKVAERVGALALEGDAMGVAIWTKIAHCMNDIITARPH